MKNISFITQPESVVVIIDSDSYIVRKDAENYSEILKAAASKDIEGLNDLLDISKSIENFSSNRVVFRGEEAFFNDRKLHGVIVKRIIEFKKAGIPFDFLTKFIERIEKNPSASSKRELYDFLENNFLPVTEDGCFLAYKGVQSDYWSSTAGDQKLLKGTVREDGRIFNGVGEEIEMERGDVDDDRDRGCSHGLHVGSWSYASNFSSICVLVKVDPSSVVSVPKECKFGKCRVCHYWVIDDAPENPLPKPIYSKNAGDNFEVSKKNEKIVGDFQSLEDDFESNLEPLENFSEAVHSGFCSIDEEDDDFLEKEESEELDAVSLRIRNYIEARSGSTNAITLRKINNSLNPLPWQPYEKLISIIEDLGYTVNKDSNSTGYRTVS